MNALQKESSQKGLYGLMAVFEDPEALLTASQQAYQRGYRKMDAYTPFPVEGLYEALGLENDGIAPITLLGGMIGGGGGFFMQWYANVIDYPIRVAGRPDFSWQSFIPITFELTILCAAFGAAFGMLLLNRLPQLYHPVFIPKEFERATKDRFFLCLEAIDPLFQFQEAHYFLTHLQPEKVIIIKESGYPNED